MGCSTDPVPLPGVKLVYKAPDSAITTFELGDLVALEVRNCEQWTREEETYPLGEPHASIAFTYSCPEATSPKTVCLPLRCGVGTVVMKNCEPLLDKKCGLILTGSSWTVLPGGRGTYVLGPEFAMLVFGARGP